MTEKAPSAFRTISEAAKELDVPQHVLRFWETRFSQVRPMKRAGGRRYYRPEDIDLLRRIRSLLYEEGYTIKGVQKLLRQTARKADAPEAGPPEASAPNAPDALSFGKSDLPSTPPFADEDEKLADCGLSEDSVEELRDLVEDLRDLATILKARSGG